MSVWKNDLKLGVMHAVCLCGGRPQVRSAGLSRWGVGSSTRIELVPAPASPTEGELVAALAWQQLHPDD